jgi:hypothetical protein
LAAFAASVRAQDSLDVEIDLSHLSQTPPNGLYHILRASTPAGQSAPLEGPELLAERLTAATEAGLLPLVLPPPVPGVPVPGFYPGDVTKLVASAKTLSNTVINPIFINCPTGSTCWGNPNAFLTDLGKSTFIHLTDQYTNTVGKFSLGTSVNVTANLTGVDDCHIRGTNPCLLDGDIRAAVNVIAQQTKIGAGYGHLYHVFLPKGFDVCVTNSEGQITGCYSPDVPSAFRFCSYHSFANLSTGHLIYSVQPFEALPGCGTAPPTVNSFLADSTDSPLGHETFEAISDPDLNAWGNLNTVALFGAEIGDICEEATISSISSGFFSAPTVVINGHNYKTQLIYSNHYHACASAP